MDFLVPLFSDSLVKVINTFIHNWPYLVVSIILAVAMKVLLNPDKISAFLQRYSKAGVVGATAVAVATPLCSCGTMAIILGMMANTMPWAPIIAFMVASPLTSPEELVYSAGLFGWPFAIAFFVSSILLGLAGGLVAGIMESRGWLKNQSRFAPAGKDAPDVAEVCSCSPAAEKPAVPQPALAESSCGCGSTSPFVPLEIAPAAVAAGCGCGSLAVISTSEPEMKPQTRRVNRVKFWEKISPETWRQIPAELWKVTRQLIPMFFIFAFVGYFLNGLIPAAWVSTVFGQGSIYSVPLAATLGLPLYINTEASLPLVRALIDGGMSQGAALAFLITGAGTSIGALTGALTIARWRVVGTVVGTLWVGAIAVGSLYNLVLSMNLF